MATLYSIAWDAIGAYIREKNREGDLTKRMNLLLLRDKLNEAIRRIEKRNEENER